MAAPIRFRAWQVEALGKLEARVHSSFLAVATPGAGKTTFALAAIRRALVAREMRRCVVVVPTQHLKLQWALAAEQFDIHLDPEWTAADGALPSDVFRAPRFALTKVQFRSCAMSAKKPRPTMNTAMARR